MMDDFECTYRVVNKNGAPVSGYNNAGGTYRTYIGARRAQVWVEGQDSRHGWDEGPYNIQESPLNWGPVTFRGL